MPWEDWSDADEVVPMTSGWMRATAPNGDRLLRGQGWTWSGELGYGVRAPEPAQGSTTPAPGPKPADRAVVPPETEQER